MARVIIVGRSISGLMAAAHLKQRQPDLDVCMIGPADEQRPLVGESIIEHSSAFFHDLGLSMRMTEEQFHKYGLTFLFKESIDDPACRRYAVHEAQRVPAMPAYMLNRETFDRLLAERCAELGVRVVDGTVKKVVLADAGPHSVLLASGRRLKARWVVDASGRSRLLARQLGLQQAAPSQRSAFWFRVKGFDRGFLDRLEAVKGKTWAFDSYHATQHFLGRGCWIWCIPIRSSGHVPLMSVGLVWRPDLFEGDVRSPEEFLHRVDREHPVVADMVRSGTVVDHHHYRHYMYEATQVYSRQGWFLVGDAGDTVDPLYSTGMENTALQVEQVGEMIRRDRCGRLDAAFVADMERGYKAPRDALQHLIHRQYEFMHDPYGASWCMHLTTLFYFHALLPCWLAGYHLDRTGARLLATMTSAGLRDFEAMVQLLPQGRERLGALRAEDIPSLFDVTVNWELNAPGDHAIPGHMATMLVRFAQFRLELLRNAGYVDWPGHLKSCVSDLARAAVLGTALRGRSLKGLPLLRKRLLGPSVHHETLPEEPGLPTRSGRLADVTATPSGATAGPG